MKTRLKQSMQIKRRSSKVHDETTANYHFIRMRGPMLKGYAEMAITRKRRNTSPGIEHQHHNRRSSAPPLPPSSVDPAATHGRGRDMRSSSWDNIEEAEEKHVAAESSTDRGGRRGKTSLSDSWENFDLERDLEMEKKEDEEEEEGGKRRREERRRREREGERGVGREMGRMVGRGEGGEVDGDRESPLSFEGAREGERERQREMGGKWNQHIRSSSGRKAKGPGVVEGGAGVREREGKGKGDEVDGHNRVSKG